MRQLVVFASLVAVVACRSSYQPASLTDPTDPRFLTVAPDSFDVNMLTTKGMMVVRVRRNWAPIGADRFYALVRIITSIRSRFTGPSATSSRSSAFTATPP
jgi:hypothetical protein